MALRASASGRRSAWEGWEGESVVRGIRRRVSALEGAARAGQERNGSGELEGVRIRWVCAFSSMPDS